MTDLKFQPTLVLGVGGTGVKVLTYIKKELLEIGHNQLPETVFLMAFDTERESRIKVGGVGRRRAPGKRTTGYVQLTAGEYVHLGGNVRRFAEQVREGEYPFLNWWNVRAYEEQQLPRFVWDLVEGAGRYRQFGRIALVYHIEKFERMVRSALQTIRARTSGTQVYIHVVASTAGGTGAGMFLDVAYLAARLATEVGLKEHKVLGYLVLSEGFRGTPQIKLDDPIVRRDFLAREFAALRELGRLQTTVTPEHPYPMIYRLDRQGTMRRAPFDMIYLFDGNREHNPLQETRLEYGLVPTIADAVVAQIDRVAGADITAHVVNVFRHRDSVGLPADVPIVGTIGTYTLVLPIYHWVERWAHRLSLEVLKRWLWPAAWDEQGHPTRLSAEHYGGRSGPRGREQVDAELRREREYFTEFLEFLWDLGRRYNGGDLRVQRQVIEELNGLTTEMWAEKLDPGFRDRKTRRARQKLLRLIEADFTRKHLFKQGWFDAGEENPFYINPNPGGSDAEQAAEVRRQVDRYLRYLLGDLRQDGRHEGGKIRDVFQTYLDKQVERFQALLTRRLKALLNGSENEPPHVARAGKLGYVIDWLEGLLEHFQGAALALEGVLTTGGVGGQTGASRSLLLEWLRGFRRSLEQMEQELDRSPGRRNRREYLRAAEEYLQSQRAAIVRALAQEAAQKIVATISEALKQLHAWREVLALHGESLYHAVLQSRLDNEADLEEMKRIKVRWILDDEAFEQAHYQRYTEEVRQALDEFMAHLGWEINPGERGRFEIFCRFGSTLWQPSLHRVERYLEELLAHARTYFDSAWSDLSINHYLVYKYSTQSEPLVQQLVKANDPPLRVATKAATEQALKAYFLRLERTSRERAEEAAEAPNFTNSLLNQIAVELGISARREEDEEQQLVGESHSQDPYKWTLLYFQDMVPLIDLAAWREGQKEYRDFPQNRSFLHIFAAEQRALRLEQEAIQILKQVPREIDNRIVTLLEYWERFLLAIRALVYGRSAFAWPGWPGASGRGVLLYLGIPDFGPPNPENKRAWALILLPDLQEARRRNGVWIDPITGDPLMPESFLLTELGNENLLDALESFIFEARDVANPQRAFHAHEYQRVRQTLDYVVDEDRKRRLRQHQLGWVPPSWLEGEQLLNAQRQAAQLATFQFWLRHEGERHLATVDRWLREEYDPKNPAHIRRRQEADLWTVIYLLVRAEVRRLHQHLDGYRGEWLSPSEDYNPYAYEDPQGPAVEPPPVPQEAPPEAVESLQEKPSPSPEPQEEQIRCPHCGGWHPKHWKFCPVTGKPLEEEIICPHCGQRHPADWKVCPYTGKPLS